MAASTCSSHPTDHLRRRTLDSRTSRAMAVVSPPLAVNAECSTFYHRGPGRLATIAAPRCRTQCTGATQWEGESPMRSLALSVDRAGRPGATPVVRADRDDSRHRASRLAPIRRPAPGPAMRWAPVCPCRWAYRASNIDQLRHAFTDRAEPAVTAGWRERECRGLSSRGAVLPAGRPHGRGATVAGDGADAPARPVGAEAQTNNPSDNPAVTQISQALRALAAGDRAQTMQLIQSAIPAATALAQ